MISIENYGRVFGYIRVLLFLSKNFLIKYQNYGLIVAFGCDGKLNFIRCDVNLDNPEYDFGTRSKEVTQRNNSLGNEKGFRCPTYLSINKAWALILDYVRLNVYFLCFFKGVFAQQFKIWWEAFNNSECLDWDRKFN